MKKKSFKLTALLLAIVLIFGLSACGANSNGGSANDNADENTVASAAVATEIPLTDEEFAMYFPENTDQSEAIAAMPGYSKDDTWAFYIYMVGSNLESCKLDELSELVKMTTKDEAEANKANKAAIKLKNIQTFTNEIRANGEDLPKHLYNPNTSQDNEEESSQPMSPDVDGSGTFNLSELAGATFGSNIKAVIQTGGAKRWQNVMINPNRSQRFLVDQNGFQEVYNEPLVDMATTTSLADFLRYCTSTYPADHEVVILWNHGSGVYGYGYDEIFDKNLSLPEMQAAFREVLGEPSATPQFEAIGFDACLMASTEVANYFSGYAKYLYASEEIEPGKGWDYAAIINTLYENPEMNGAQLGKVVADSFLRLNSDTMKVSHGAGMLTFSVTDLAKSPAVYGAYAAFAASALQRATQDVAELSAISRAASWSVSYAGDSYKYWNTCDLGLFMSELPETYKEESARVLNALNDAVLYARNSYLMQGSTGLSIYYPLYISNVDGLNGTLYFLETISQNDDINALYYYKIAGCLNNKYQQYLTDKGLRVPEPINFNTMNRIAALDLACDGDGNFSTQLNAEQLALTQDVRFELAEYDPETGDIVYYGEDAYAQLDEDGSISTVFGGNWITLGDVYLPLEIASATSENIIYSTPIQYKEMDAFLLTVYNVQENTVGVVGVCLEADMANPGRNCIPLNEGDEITVLKEFGNVNSLVRDNTTETIRIRKNTTLEQKPLKDGVYLEFLKVMDLRDDDYYSKIISFRVSDGKISDQQVEEALLSYVKD